MYEKGEGVPKDSIEALQWLIRAANPYHPDADQARAERKLNDLSATMTPGQIAEAMERSRKQ
jgi:TPR repeat protein